MGTVWRGYYYKDSGIHESIQRALKSFTNYKNTLIYFNGITTITGDDRERMDLISSIRSNTKIALIKKYVENMYYSMGEEKNMKNNNKINFYSINSPLLYYTYKIQVT